MKTNIQFNSPYSDCSVVLPKGMPSVYDFVKDEMRKQGESVEFIEIPCVNYVKRPDKEFASDVLSSADMMRLFKFEEAMYMTYIPHFLTQAVLHYADLLMRSAAKAKMSEYKKHMRYLRMLRDEYMRRLRKEMPARVYERFLSQREQYIESCSIPLMKLYFTISNALAYRYKHVDNEEVYCYATIIEAITSHVEEYDREVNAEIAKRLHTPRHNYSDEMMECVKDLCRDISGKYPLDKDVKYNSGIGVLTAKAKTMINEMIKEV